MPLLDPIRNSLRQLEQQSLRRERRLIETAGMAGGDINRQSFLSFAHNDYLGLTLNAEVKAALFEGIERWGNGSGASQLLGGYSTAQQQLERAIASFLGFPAALAFSTGYMANLALAPTLLGKNDAIFSDALNHASLIDAAVLSRSQRQIYPHLDMGALEIMLTNSQARAKMIVTDAVFSMDGDIAPLPKLLELAQKHDAWLVVDDAHGFGVLGREGRGSLEHFSLDNTKPETLDKLIWVVTFGKAAGIAGAAIAGHQDLIDYLISRARTAIFTTAPPSALSYGLCKSIEVIAKAGSAREKLKKYAAILQRELPVLLKDKNWHLLPSQTPIQPIMVGDNGRALEASRLLSDQGIWVPAIRPPTVPEGTARLRISLSAAHGERDIDRLLEAMRYLAFS